jgi:hypothetical protein
MKKIVFVFGLIGGFVFMIWMIAIYAFYYNTNREESYWLGYGSMIVAFSFVFVGIKSYRDKYLDGHISFGKAFQVGLYITLIASTIYVLAWLVDLYVFMPDFMDKYVAHALAHAKSHGASLAELDKQKAQMAGYVQMYKSPLGVIGLTYMEVLPVGLVITLIAALILKRPNTKQELAIV